MLNSVRARGVTLVVFPLICQLAFVSILFVLLLQVQSELIRESRTRELAGCAHEIMRDVIEIITYSYLGHDRGQLMDAETSKQKVQRLLPKLEKVMKLSHATGTGDSKETARFQTASRDMLDLFAWACKEQEKGIVHWRKVKGPLDHAMMGRSQVFMTALNDLLAHDKSNNSDAPDPILVALEDKLKAFLIIAFVASLLLAALLGSIFVAGISRPLIRLTVNGQRLSRRQELLPPLTGDDQFSQLDRLFHATSSAIAEAVKTEQAMVENAADLICTLDSGGVFTKVNPYAAVMFACPVEELLGKSLYDLVLPEDLVKTENEIASAVISQKTQIFEIRLRKGDGTAIDTRWSALWSDHEGTLFCVVHDITEARNIERLKQDFLDMISHDLRSPLTAMLASMTMMSAGVRGPLPDSALKKVKESVRDIEQLIDFVNDLLDYQKLQAGRMPIIIQTTGFGALISESVGNVKSIAAEKKVKISIASGTWQLNCDKPKIGQVLINLLTYAIDESLEGKNILIDVDESTDALECCIKYIASRTEPGENLFERISEIPIYSGGRPGIGVRLALCKLIVESHGGEVGTRHEKFAGERFARKVRTEFDTTIWFSIPTNKAVGQSITSQQLSLH